MKVAPLSELKHELADLSKGELLALCLRLARFKKDNKELLTYLVFEAADLEAYIAGIDEFMTHEFSLINYSQSYFAKKSLRRLLRLVNKYIRYTGSRQAEAGLLIRFCELLKNSGISFKKNTQIQKMYSAQLLKIDKAIATLHPDLGYDYKKRASELPIGSSSKFSFF